MIYINDIPSFRNPENYEYNFDDRVEKIEVMDGIIVQDRGHITAGDYFAVEVMFTQDNLERVLDLWERREKVSFTDTAGVVWQGMRIVMKSFRRDSNFPRYVIASFHLWRK